MYPIQAHGVRPRGRFGTRALLAACALAWWFAAPAANPPRITAFDRAGNLAWTNVPVPGVCGVEAATALNGAWRPGGNVFATNSRGGATLTLSSTNRFFRLRTVPVPPTSQGFTNLAYSYGLLETIVGNGAGREDDTNYWSAAFENGPATNAALSRPHFAMADRAGNIYIVDKDSHSVLKVNAQGVISTWAGTHVAGYNGEGAAATNLQLSYPNGLWVRADGTIYVLDTGNGRVRRVATNGVMTTLFVDTSDNMGRGLWVKDDESLVYFCANSKVRSWTSATGSVATVAKGFSELGDLCVEASGNLLVCDRGANYLYRLTPQGDKTVLAGNGTSTGGGNGQPALQTGLYGARCPWPVPTGGCLLLTHDGCQLWYVDSAGTNYLLLNGAGDTTHSGDGGFFYAPGEARISEGRSVCLDYQGNILVCESDYGYVRRIRFQRFSGN